MILEQKEGVKVNFSSKILAHSSIILYFCSVFGGNYIPRAAKMLKNKTAPPLSVLQMYVSISDLQRKRAQKTTK